MVKADHAVIKMQVAVARVLVAHLLVTNHNVVVDRTEHIMEADMAQDVEIGVEVALSVAQKATVVQKLAKQQDVLKMVKRRSKRSSRKRRALAGETTSKGNLSSSIYGS